MKKLIKDYMAADIARFNRHPYFWGHAILAAGVYLGWLYRGLHDDHVHVRDFSSNPYK